MISLKQLGFAEYYLLDETRIFNNKKNEYVKEIAEFRYRLNTIDGKRKSITMKEIYKRLFDEIFCIDNTTLLEGEEFREIEGTNGNYAISNKGRVKSFIGNRAAILNPYISDNGYKRVNLYVDGKRYNKFVHVLVCGAFLEPPKSLDYEVHHLKDKLQNDVQSLVYMSKSEHRKLHRNKEEQKCLNTTVTQISEV